MPSPEVWGPPTWTLFHSLAHNLPEETHPTFKTMRNETFSIIKLIAANLPCPHCTEDASRYLNSIDNLDKIFPTRISFINRFYEFHNWVNKKKGKPLYNYALVEGKYAKVNPVVALKPFLWNFNTRGNMTLINDSFRRTHAVTSIVKWFDSRKKIIHSTFILRHQKHNIEVQQLQSQPKTVKFADVSMLTGGAIEEKDVCE